MHVLGNYEQAVERADALIARQGIQPHDLVQCDTLCYRVETNERYDQMKQELARVALALGEQEVNGRLIATYMFHEPLTAGRWQTISYVELPQPKPNRVYTEGVDDVLYVTRQSLSEFQAKYSSIAFEEKSLANVHNPLLEIEGEGMAVKFHDKHMGVVVELERAHNHAG